MAEETAEEQLGRLRRQMARALRRGETGEFERLSALYADLKAAEVERVHREQREAARARRAASVAQQAAEEPRRWRLPPGFRSPLAMERARSGIRPREEPPGPPPSGLRPWRRPWPPSEVIWRPPS